MFSLATNHFPPYNPLKVAKTQIFLATKDDRLSNLNVEKVVGLKLGQIRVVVLSEKFIVLIDQVGGKLLMNRIQWNTCLGWIKSRRCLCTDADIVSIQSNEAIWVTQIIINIINREVDEVVLSGFCEGVTVATVALGKSILSFSFHFESHIRVIQARRNITKAGTNYSISLYEPTKCIHL